MSIKVNINPFLHSIQNNTKVNSVLEKTKFKGNTNTNSIKGDSITISAYGKSKSAGTILPNKVNNALKGLMKQRENLLDRKNDMMADMLEKGKSPEAIKEQMKELDEQLKELEKEIAKIQFEEQQKNMKLDEEKQREKENISPKKNSNSSSNDKEGLSSKTMKVLVSASSDLKQIDTAAAVKTKLEGRSRVLKKEIELDESRSLDGKASENKYKEYDKLQDGISNLTEDIGKKSSELSEKISENLNSEDPANPNTTEITKNQEKEKEAKKKEESTNGTMIGSTVDTPQNKINNKQK